LKSSTLCASASSLAESACALPHKPPRSSALTPRPPPPPFSHRRSLDFKRANNLNISLAQFRKFSHDKLFAAVYRLDKAALPREVLEKLMLVLPTADEVKLLKAYKGKRESLMECDKFVFAVSHVPRFGAKVSAFSASLFVSSAAADVEKRILLLTGACAQLMESTRLQSVLACVLRLGNTLNAGSRLGGAAAISLESLQKLPATKAADKKTTLMDALVMLVEKKFGADMLQWADDLKDTTPAARIELSELRGEVARLRAAVAAAKAEADAEDADVAKDAAAIAALAADDGDAAPPKAAEAAPAPAASAPAPENDPRKAMLAQLMLKRAGPSAGGGVAAPAPAPPKVKPTLSTNPCALGDRRLFVSGMRTFVAAVEATLATLDSLVGVAARASSDLAEYFGEDPHVCSARDRRPRLHSNSHRPPPPPPSLFFSRHRRLAFSSPSRISQTPLLLRRLRTQRRRPCSQRRRRPLRPLLRRPSPRRRPCPRRLQRRQAHRHPFVRRSLVSERGLRRPHRRRRRQAAHNSVLAAKTKKREPAKTNPSCRPNCPARASA
jgi:hypothetical protein